LTPKIPGIGSCFQTRKRQLRREKVSSKKTTVRKIKASSQKAKKRKKPSRSQKEGRGVTNRLKVKHVAGGNDAKKKGFFLRGPGKRTTECRRRHQEPPTQGSTRGLFVTNGEKKASRALEKRGGPWTCGTVKRQNSWDNKKKEDKN